MKMVSLALASLLALTGASASAQTSGTVTHKGVSMPVTHAVAVAWEDKVCPLNQCLQVYLLPFAPSAQETAGSRRAIRSSSSRSRAPTRRSGRSRAPTG